MLTPFEKYILNYRDEKGNLVCTIQDYYLLNITPLHEKFTHYKLSPSQLAICPLHNDHDPSFGIIKRKFPEGSYSFHCFGCGKAGTVIRLHQLVSVMYNNKELTVNEACTELCSLFGIPIPNLEEIADDDYEKLFYKKYQELDRLGSGYSSKDFSNDILAVRKNGVTLDAINSACVKLIATKKELYTK